MDPCRFEASLGGLLVEAVGPFCVDVIGPVNTPRPWWRLASLAVLATLGTHFVLGHDVVVS
jgi:hypothetical protein